MVFRCFNTRSLLLLRHRLLGEEPKFVVYELDGKSIRDKRTLFDAFRLSTPYEKKVPSVGLSWTAFDEVLTTSLIRKGDEYVAILWHDAQPLLEGSLPLLLEFGEVVNWGQASLRDAGIVFRVLLLGDGPNFPNYTDDGMVSGHRRLHPLL